MRATLSVKGVLALCLLSLTVLACDDRAVDLEREHPIPRRHVALRILLDYEGRGLRDPYSFMVFTQPLYEGEQLGHMGVVVVHSAVSKYSAYDLACPYCWPERVAVVPTTKSTKGLVIAECPKCQSVYDLALGIGTPVDGPAKYPLLDYLVVQIDESLLVQ